MRAEQQSVPGTEEGIALCCAVLRLVTLQSVSAATSTASSRSSRKRAREIVWCDVLEGTGILIPATEFNTPHHFVDMNQSQQESFLTRLGLASREQDLLKTKLQEALESKPVPSPSAMKWSDVPAILHGKLPSHDTPLVEPPDVTSDLFTDAILESIIHILPMKVRRLSEMEVVVRVFLMVLIAVSDKQPTVKDHASFTDFLIWITNRVGEVRFIEVKRADISVDLTVEADSTAQTLREAHVLLCSRADVKALPFVLTNGASWSFGIAAKHSASKLLLKSVHNVLCSITTLSGWKLAINNLRAFLYGSWPPLAAAATHQPEL